jgi:chitin disaccharide deacetylase
VKQLVVTADDLGLSLAVNEAVRSAHREGILTCASLMIAAPAADEAVAMAKAEGLPVGLHLTLVDGRSMLPPARVPDLVDARGLFRTGLGGPAVRLGVSARARSQARAECEAQLEAFLATGLKLDHVNAHHHFHLHPSVLTIVVELARRYRAAVRIPFEPAVPPYRATLLAATMAPWALRARRRLRRAGIVTNDALFGLYDTGVMTEHAWLRIVPRIGPGLTEVYCHPSVEPPASSELVALLSPVVRAALDRADIRRMSFAEAACA